MAERQMFIISDLADNDEYTVYSFGKNLFNFDLKSIFETIDKKYLEVMPGQLLYAFIDKSGNFLNSDENSKFSVALPGKNTAKSTEGERIYSTISEIGRAHV